MALTYGFYNSVDHDRKYNATHFSNLFDGIINDGVFSSIGTGLVVQKSSGMTVNVGTGRAWFNKTWTNNDALLPLVIEASHAVLNRIDAIVLEVDTSQATRANSIKVIKGTAASTPVNPTLTNTELVHQHPLAYIYVGAGVTEITQTNITNKVGTTDCPFVTGVMATISIDGFLAQWNAEFEDWFENVKAQLEGNVVTNLQNQIDARLQLAGGTMTGDIVLKGAPTANLHPATKLYTDNLAATKLPLAGGTMTGAIVLSGAPTANLHPATKLYVDNLIANIPIPTLRTGTTVPASALGVNGDTYVKI